MASTRFFILTQGRTGSNLLCSLLNAHPQIHADGEIMNLKEQKKMYHPIHLLLIRQFPHWFIQQKETKAHRKGSSVYGFKLLVEQWPKPIETGVQQLIEHNFKPIYLFRKNIISQLISTTLANQSNQWVVKSTKQYSHDVIELDLTVARKKLEQIQRRTLSLRKLSAQFQGLELYYEDHLMFDDLTQKSAEMICSYLGLNFHPLQSPMLKTDLRSDRERFSNLDEFLDVMRSAGMEKEIEYYLMHEHSNH